MILLLEVKKSDPVGQKKAMRRLEVCLRSLYEMNINWDWANRSIRAVQSLAAQWKIDMSKSAILNEIGEEYKLSFQRYERSCPEFGPKLGWNDNSDPSEHVRPSDPFDEFFTAWVNDQGMMDGTFDFFASSN